MDITHGRKPENQGLRPGLARHALAAAAVLSLAGAPAALAGPFDSIKNMMPTLPARSRS